MADYDQLSRSGGSDIEFISAASAPLHHHLLIIFQHHLVVLVQIQHGNGAQFGGDTAGLRDARINGVDQGLHNGMIG